jgi:hypothetical protein
MRSWRLPFAVSVVTLIALAACVADDPTTGSGDDTSGNDASTDGSSSGNDGSIGSDGSITTTDSGVDSGPKRYCQTISPPDGSADFFCADFDGTNLTEGFLDASVTDASSISADHSIYFSSPTSLNVMLNGAAGETAYLSWPTSGSANLSQVTASTEIREVTVGGTHQLDGYVFLLSIAFTGSYEVDYGYTFGGSVTDASTYEGYVLNVRHSPGLTRQYPVNPNALPAGWTNVSLSVDVDTGDVTLSYGGTVIGTAPGFGATEGAATIQVGGSSFNDLTTGGNWLFDNFQVSTVRVDGG